MAFKMDKIRIFKTAIQTISTWCHHPKPDPQYVVIITQLVILDVMCYQCIQNAETARLTYYAS
jgi:hypothetical protein